MNTSQKKTTLRFNQTILVEHRKQTRCLPYRNSASDSPILFHVKDRQNSLQQLVENGQPVGPFTPGQGKRIEYVGIYALHVGIHARITPKYYMQCNGIIGTVYGKSNFERRLLASSQQK